MSLFAAVVTVTADNVVPSFAWVIEPSAGVREISLPSFAAVTAPAAIFSVVTAKLFIFAVVIALDAISAATTVPSAILAAVIAPSAILQ